MKRQADTSGDAPKDEKRIADLVTHIEKLKSDYISKYDPWKKGCVSRGNCTTDCQICSTNGESTVPCKKCRGTVCDNGLCSEALEETTRLCVFCAQDALLYKPCGNCKTTEIPQLQQNVQELMLKYGSFQSRGGSHPLLEGFKTCKTCQIDCCKKCINYQDLCVDCKIGVSDVWYQKIGATVLDISLAVPEKKRGPDSEGADLDDNSKVSPISEPEPESILKTTSGAPLTILKSQFMTKGPYARCCECDVRYLYDSGLDSKGKPCECVCDGDRTGEFCDSRPGIEIDYYVDYHTNGNSNEERHLEIETFATCCSAEYDQSVYVKIPPCTASFPRPGQLALHADQEYHGDCREKVVCSRCVERYVFVCCEDDCIVLFDDAEALEDHMEDRHGVERTVVIPK